MIEVITGNPRNNLKHELFGYSWNYAQFRKDHLKLTYLWYRNVCGGLRIPYTGLWFCSETTKQLMNYLAGTRLDGQR